MKKSNTFAPFNWLYFVLYYPIPVNFDDAAVSFGMCYCAPFSY